ncbi:MAG: hypothetical protein AB1779_00910 [Candidatus Thermoplasmatota archaeon]
MDEMINKALEFADFLMTLSKEEREVVFAVMVIFMKEFAPAEYMLLKQMKEEHKLYQVKESISRDELYSRIMGVADGH